MVGLITGRCFRGSDVGICPILLIRKIVTALLNFQSLES